jgi:hypothetical protein
MREDRKLRRSESTRAFFRIALLVLVVGGFSAKLSYESVASALTEPHAQADVSPDYGGGILMATDPNGGYWTVTADGGVTSFAGAPSFGSPLHSGLHLSQPAVGMASTDDGDGYWVVAADGGVFSYGDAHFYGSTGAIHLNQPIVGMASTPDGKGYWLVASDGGIFSFGDAHFYGSTGAIHLNKPIVGMATTDGGGYWLVASDGGIFSFGDAHFYGSTGAIHLNEPIVGMASSPDGHGYWIVASDGGIFSFGDAHFYGSLGGSGKSVIGIIVDPMTPSYTLVATNGTATEEAPEDPSGGTPPTTPPTTTPTTTPPTTTPTTQGAGTSGSDCLPNVSPTAAVDTSLDSLFANQSGPGWVGGDATYSTDLPNGDEAFDFSDTLIGSAQSDGTATFNGMPHSSELVGAMPDLGTNVGGTYGAPESLIPDTADNGDSWQVGATYVENGDQLVFVNEFAPVPGSEFDQYTGRSGIAVFSLPTSGMPVFSSITLLPTDAQTQWGQAVTQSGGYTYIYGSDINFSEQVFFGMKIARVATGDSLNTDAWEYWNGSQWVSGESNAQPVVTSNVLTGVTPDPSGNGFVAVSIPGGVYDDTTVDLSYACSAQGPWSSPEAVYSIPQIAEYNDEIAYIPTFHPELSQSGLVISYNINTTDGLSALQQDVHEYQPQFLQLSS